MPFHASTKTLHSSMTKGTLSKRLGGITKGTPGQRSTLLQVCMCTPSLWISINISRPITSSTSRRKQRTLLLSHCNFINRRRKDEESFYICHTVISHHFHPCRNGAVRWRPPAGRQSGPWHSNSVRSTHHSVLSQKTAVKSGVVLQCIGIIPSYSICDIL